MKHTMQTGSVKVIRGQQKSKCCPKEAMDLNWTGLSYSWVIGWECVQCLQFGSVGTVSGVLLVMDILLLDQEQHFQFFEPVVDYCCFNGFGDAASSFGHGTESITYFCLT
mmetsp:Transcript_14957/g.24182  ORF Transcript_14957/g.24182 Transcript_14957/m.24182 type:complete len:110 (+) Transcript_14957:179-508(+)